MYYGTVSQSENWPTFLCNFVTETFGFEDENDFEYEIWLQLFSRIFLKKETSQKASLYLLFTKKLAMLSLLKEVKPSSVRKNDKTSTTW